MAGVYTLAQIKDGARIGMWTVRGNPDTSKPMWSKRAECQCECGTIRLVLINRLKSGLSTNCGCGRMEKMLAAAKLAGTTHGMSKKCVEYSTWCGIKQRCYSPSRKDWHIYGGRGIAMCDRWKNSFEAFYSDMGPRPKGYSIERIDANGNYEPGNCVWASAKTQSFNRSATISVSYKGRTMSFREACLLSNQKYTTAMARYKRGIPLSELFDQ